MFSHKSGEVLAFLTVFLVGLVESFDSSSPVTSFFAEDVFLVIFFLVDLGRVDAILVSSFSSSALTVVYSCSDYFLSLFFESELKKSKSILGILISLALFKKAIN